MMAVSSRSMRWQLIRDIVSISSARFRYVLAVGLFLSILAAWPYLRNTIDKYLVAVPASGAVSADTEYWCPMCPGVLSDWPAKCPVCNMTLVRRQKGEMTPLPDGVVARVQLSPYRIQLAGLRTSPVEYRRLMCNVVIAGLLEAKRESGTQAPLAIQADVYEPDASMVSIGQTAQVRIDTFADEESLGRIVDISQSELGPSRKRIVVRVENPKGEYRPGLYASAHFQTPLAMLESSRRAERLSAQDLTAVSLFTHTYASPATITVMGTHYAASTGGLTLSIPESAVIDTGAKRFVYTVSMPGVYDAVEVQLGRRCGDYYPVRGGLDAGQLVVTTGSILLDAETRLNPNVAAGYFGSGTRIVPTQTLPTVQPNTPPAPSVESDSSLIAKQKICPVTGEPLGSMGAPVRVAIAGRSVFVCCKGCEKPLLKKPDEYLAKLPK